MRREDPFVRNEHTLQIGLYREGKVIMRSLANRKFNRTFARWFVFNLVCILSINYLAASKVLNIVTFGAIVKVKTPAAAQKNTLAINNAFNASMPGDTILISKGSEFFATGGIVGFNLINVTILLLGQLRAMPDIKSWPLQQLELPRSTTNNTTASSRLHHVNGAKYMHFIHLVNCSGVSISGTAPYPSKADGSGQSLVDGNGLVWWNKYVISTKYAKRPKLIVIEKSENIVVENMTAINSPSFHMLLKDNINVIVRFVTINVDRKLKAAREKTKRILLANENVEGLQPEDLNTDGIDPSGKNVHVHHVFINNDDDSIAVKPCSRDSCDKANCSEDMLFEDMIVTGFGLSIGSVPPHKIANCVRNITFRRISMPKTGKGIYIKSNPSCDENSSAVIENIVYEDINITYPRWWAIWIGPQQQHEPGQTLGLKCPLDYPITSRCPTQSCVTFNNITLRNIHIEKPVLSPGVILGNQSNPMRNIVFDNVRVNDPGKWPFDNTYQCKHAHIRSIGGTMPAPLCLQ